MAVVATFLVNLLCSIVSCEAKLPEPEIRDNVNIIPSLSLSTGFGEFGLRTAASSTIFAKVDAAEIIAVTQYGKVSGYSLRTAGNRRISAFEGIPYAAPPVGKGRFRSPSPPQSWDGVRDAKKPGSECLQLSLPRRLRVAGSEDCLYLNVYTPASDLNFEGALNSARPLLPVVVVIHGGSYYWGAGHELGPSYLLDKNVILVTLNYRLGVLGFLSTGDKHSPGNFGLKDQSLAIKWVYQNIPGFGGDPTRITLMGQNSGAACSHLHLLSNSSSPFISSGVSLSGSAFSHWALKSPKESTRLTTALAKAVSCPVSQGSAALVDCLRQRNPVDLVAAQYSLLEFAPFPNTLFSPVVENREESHGFLIHKPEVAYTSGAVEGKPWIFGQVGQEGYLGLSMLQSFAMEGNIRSKWEEVAPIYLDYKHSVQNVSEVTRKLAKFYFGNKHVQNVKGSKLAAVYGDRLTLSGLDTAIRAHSSVGGAVYPYIFGFKGKYSLGKGIEGRVKGSKWGVGCGEDLYYFFNSSTYMPGFKKADLPELAISNVMTTFLANFAATGEPLLPQEDSVYSRLWEPVTSSYNVNFLQLNREIRMIPQPFKKRLNFWTNILARDEPTLLNPLYDVR